MADPRFHQKSEAMTLMHLAEISGGVVQGNGDLMIEDVAALKEANASEISFLDNIKYKDDFKNTKAGACIISEKMAEFAPQDCQLIISKNPYKSYALIAQAFYGQLITVGTISDNAHIDPSATINAGVNIEAGAVIHAGATIGKNCVIGANAVIGENVELGDNTIIRAGATVSHAVIGQACHIYPGARIGQDGFGFAIDPAGHVKVPQLGRVIIGDHVEIGANSCIDRGAGPDTLIGDGTWIDNLVQIAHNVKIGRGCVIIAQVGIAGSTTLEDYAVVAAQTGIAGHLTIGMGAKIGAKSGVMRDVPAGVEMLGVPAVPAKQFFRQAMALNKLATKK